MPAVDHLSHLIKLLDDDSEVVRHAVRQELNGMRRELPECIERLETPLSHEEERLVAQLLEPARRTELEETWMRWRWMDGPDAQLEEGLSQLSAFINGWRTQSSDLAKRLDTLAETAFAEKGRMDAHELAQWLFASHNGVTRFRGNSKDYYSPSNSNLFWVLDTGLGNPISLCCLYRLLGQRFGLEIEGCNFPGHFLSRVRYRDNTWLVDCFNRGRFMLAADVAKHHPAANPGMEDLIHEPATAEATLLRILRNLDEAYERIGLLQERQFMRRLAVKLMED
ncbi:transglutaminase-like domain-containing protein [Prosthecobacter vanneervenii]|uniref:Regulator of sirC expression with transglutaminase-like and TPR domain n=1 Tax=Prosthecobacter vanneervenii TaxID=48466 RepID=A0A7W7YDA5_9BACT|nr:transglutaminase-like domain-containing protein [Prosthecobacter vanneervenii]MBB5034078.1 regulator of sirC expression with transglutaminase-like and TPR domain [Prosthecobacter vanneervenii]